MKKLICVAITMCACSDSTPDVDDLEAAGDHAERLVLEGTEVTDLLGATGVSNPIRLDDGFRRVGLLWDASAEGAIEVRTSLDGATWSEWTAPTVSSVEEVAHTGHVDAFPELAQAGSTAGDPVASWIQLRSTTTPPTFLVVEPLIDVPPYVNVKELVTEASSPYTLYVDDRPTPIGPLKIYSRADWGAKAPRCASGSMTPNRATIHHTVTPTNDSMSPQARLRQIQTFHQVTRGWCDIGYNYLMSRDGRVWRGRGPTTVGAHVENNNTGNIGISVMGTYTSTAPTATQLCQAAKLLRRLSIDFGGVDLNRSDVKGHRQLGSTECPGNALYSRIDLILRKARGGCNVN